MADEPKVIPLFPNAPINKGNATHEQVEQVRASMIKDLEGMIEKIKAGEVESIVLMSFGKGGEFDSTINGFINPALVHMGLYATAARILHVEMSRGHI